MSGETMDLLRIADVLARVPISRAHLYRLIARNEAPAPIHLGRTALWRAADVEAWIASIGNQAS